MPIAQRGEVWRVDFGLAGKVRPAVVVSVSFLDYERALFTVVPHTTSLRETRFEARVEVRGLQPGAFDPQGIRSIPAAALQSRLATLSPEQLQKVEGAVRAWLGLH